MSAHLHSQFVEGCYRCELGRDEMDDRCGATTDASSGSKRCSRRATGDSPYCLQHRRIERDW